MNYLLIILPTLISAVDGIDTDVIHNNTSLTPPKFIIKLGGLFTIFHRGDDERCDTTKMFSSSVQWLEMTMYTIDYINRNDSFLPGVKIVLEPFADCLVDTRALQRIVERYIPRDKTATRNNTYWALIGPETSEVSVPTAKLLGLFDIPQISFSATSPVLSDKQRFPFYFRTAPSDTYQIAAMIQLLNYNGWTYVSFIYEDNDYGTHAFDAFQKQTINTSICVAVEIKLPRTPSEETVDVMIERLASDSTANVVIVFATEYNLALILRGVLKKNLETRFQWIGSDTWNGIQITDLVSFLNNDSYTAPLNTAVDGAISLTLHSLPDGNFSKFLRSVTPESTHNPYFAQYLAFLHKCSWNNSNPNFPDCPENMTLPEDQDLSLMLQTAANAPLAYAHALHNAQQDLCDDTGVEVCDQFAKLSGLQLREYLRNVSFRDANQLQFEFNQYQDGPARYDIWRYDGLVKFQWKLIGMYKDNQVTFHNKSHARGRGHISSTCGSECDSDQYMLYQEVQTCCWVCVKCPENSIVITNSSGNRKTSHCESCGDDFFASKNHTCVPIPINFLSFEEQWAWAVAAISCLGMILTILVVITYLWYWNTALIRASARELSSIILAGLFLAFATSFFFCFKPTQEICSLRRLGTGISFSLIYSAILVKTVRISLIFNTLGRKLVRDYKRLLRPLPQVVITAIFTSIEIFLLVIWLVMVPPGVTNRRSASLHDDIPTNFLDCSGLRDHVILIGISFPILLVLICSVYAFRIRKVPAGFNEAKHIGFAVYTTLVIWLAQVSTYLANSSTNVVLRDAIYCLGLSLNGLIILFAIFGPKVYIVIFRPEKNNQRMVMGTQASRMRSLSSQYHSSNMSPTRADERKRVSSQLPLPQVNTTASNSDVWRKIYLQRDVIKNHAFENVGPVENHSTSENREGGDGTPTSSPVEILADAQLHSVTSSEDTSSITSQDSRRWERDFMSSFDAIAKATTQKPIQNNNDVKSLNGVINTRTTRMFEDEAFPKERYSNDMKGWTNFAFQSDVTLSRARSLPKGSDLCGTRDRKNDTRGSLRVLRKFSMSAK